MMANVVVDGRLDVDVVRSHFPALKQNQVFFDNAGGSQVLSDVINSCVSCYPCTLVFMTDTLFIRPLVSEHTLKRPTSSSVPRMMSARKRQRNTMRVSKLQLSL